MSWATSQCWTNPPSDSNFRGLAEVTRRHFLLDNATATGWRTTAMYAEPGKQAWRNLLMMMFGGDFSTSNRAPVSQ